MLDLSFVFSMVDTFCDETGVLDFTRSQNGSGMSNKAAARKLVAILQQHCTSSGSNLVSLTEIRQLMQVCLLSGY